MEREYYVLKIDVNIKYILLMTKQINEHGDYCYIGEIKNDLKHGKGIIYYKKWKCKI